MDKKSKKITLRLNTKRHTEFGISAFILSIASIVFSVIAISISAFADRTREGVIISIGMIGLVAILTCVVGIIYGIIGELSKETFKEYAHLGIGLNGIMLIFHIFVLLYGYTL